MPTNYVAPTANFLSKTLNGSITDAVTTITLNNTTSVQAPGYAVIDRTDSAGTATPNAREVISYTGVSGSDLTGVTRGADGSTARTHADGALVEFTPTIGMWNSLATIVATAVTSDGYLKAIASPVSIAIMNIGTRLQISGASLTGFGIYPTFTSPGNYSGPTLAIGGILSSPVAATLQWVSAATRYVVSTASIGVDFKIRDASVFANATTRPAIAAGGTYVSTASIATRNINPGNLLSADIATVGTDGFVRTISIQGGTA